jgi:hypothetical protein
MSEARLIYLALLCMEQTETFANVDLTCMLNRMSDWAIRTYVKRCISRLTPEEHARVDAECAEIEQSHLGVA